MGRGFRGGKKLCLIKLGYLTSSCRDMQDDIHRQSSCLGFRDLRLWLRKCTGCQVSYFSYFFLFSEKILFFLFFIEIPIFSYFSAVFFGEK